jgi:general secretion pathway protein D
MRRKRNLQLIPAIAVFFACLGPPVLAIAQQASNEVSLNFVNADIDVVLRAVGKITNRNFIIDPRVKGTLNITTNNPVSSAAAYQIILSALRLQGFTVVEERGVVKVVPEGDAKLHAVPVSSARGGVRGDQLVTQVFSIRNESATQLVPIVRPLVSPNNVVIAYAGNNTLVVTDYAENVERIARLLDAIDVPQSDVAVIPIKHASALDLVATVSRMIGDGSTGDASQRVSVVPDTRLNALLVRSDSPERIGMVRRLIAALDQPGIEGNIHVIYLKNAEAIKIAQTLRSVLAGESSQAAGATGTTTPGAPPPPGRQSGPAGAGTQTGGGIVFADPVTNALIITAPEAIYTNIRRVIDQLDRRRAQVFVEALIAEVSADQATEFGIQWQSGNVPTGPSGTSQLFGGTNFGAGGNNILGLATNPASVSRGLNLIIGKGTITLPGATTPILSLSALARFLENQANTNILSTPNIVMLDNEEGKIVVGQNLPFVTGQYANTGGGTTPANPFQTIERRDVGLTLRIRPQISEGGAILMQIHQETSSVIATSLAGPATNKRSIETVTLVDDGAIIALGGLVQDSLTSGVEKVPLLGDLPLVGNLFRYDTRQRTKTNMFVFLRPKILRDSESYQGLTNDRYDYVIGQQRSIVRRENLMPGEPLAPELPAQPPPPGAATPANAPAPVGASAPSPAK